MGSVNPIIIPSKMIYSVKHNPFADNKITGVSLEEVYFSQEAKEDVSVFDGNFDIPSDQEEVSKSRLSVFNYSYLEGQYTHEIEYSLVRVKYVTIQCNIQYNEASRFVENLTGKFSYHLNGYKTEGDWEAYIPSRLSGKYTDDPNIQISSSSATEEPFEIKSEDGKFSNGSVGNVAIEVIDKTNGIFSDKSQGADGVWHYTATITVPCYFEKASVSTTKIDTHALFEGTVKGDNYIKLQATKVNIVIFGNTIEISWLGENKVYGETNKDQTFSISSNELLQKNSLFGQDLRCKTLAESVMASYKNGKQTAVIRCGFGEYYKANAAFAISTKTGSHIPMYFPLYSVVRPYVKNQIGEDVPLASKNNSPLQFVVVGRKTIYDGELMQELYLQEAKDSYNEYYSIYANDFGNTLSIVTPNYTISDGTLKATAALGG